MVELAVAGWIVALGLLVIFCSLARVAVLAERDWLRRATDDRHDVIELETAIDELKAEIAEREEAAAAIIKEAEDQADDRAPFCLEDPLVRNLWEVSTYWGRSEDEVEESRKPAATRSE